jgi:flagellar hook-associated protein 2
LTVGFNGQRTATFTDADLPAGALADNYAFRDALNNWLLGEFGSDGGTGGGQRVTATLDGNRLVITPRAGHTISVTGTQNTLDALQLTPQSTNRTPAQINALDFLGGGATGFDFTINNVRFQYTGGVFRVGAPGVTGTIVPHEDELTLQNVMAAVNSSNAGVRMTFNATTGLINMESTRDGASANISMTETAGGLLHQLGFMSGGSANIATNRTQIARDAVIYLDGQRFEREGNRFTINDITIQINASVIENDAATPPIELNIGLTRDTTATMDMLRNFVEEYNNLIRSIRELTETRRPRVPGGSGPFMPLTEEQRRGMSEREVELWEEQARTGILHRNDTLRDLTRRLHSAVFQNVYTEDGRTLNLLHMGFRTSNDMRHFGEIIIDEARLNYVMENHVDDLRDVFTQSSNINPGSIHSTGDPRNAEVRRLRTERLNESGVAMRLNDILMWETMGGGGIHDQVGNAVENTQNSVLGRRINEADRRIDNIMRDLQRREQRYFERFSRLEAAMMQAQSQMMWMDQMIFGAMQ